MQKFSFDSQGMECDEYGQYYEVSEVAERVDELNAEIESLTCRLDSTSHNCSAFEDCMGNLQVENGKLLQQVNTLRDILKLLVPDLKLMAAAAQAMGNPARAQALNNICKGVEL